METHEFISENVGSTNAHAHHNYRTCRYWAIRCVLITALVLVIGSLLLGLILYDCQKDVQVRTYASEKLNVTCTTEKDTGSDVYKIYTIPITGKYLIYGRVEKKEPQDGSDTVILCSRLRKEKTIERSAFTTCSRVVFFVHLISLEENTVLYLKFNHEPDLKNHTFHIYEM